MMIFVGKAILLSTIPVMVLIFGKNAQMIKKS